MGWAALSAGDDHLLGPMECENMGKDVGPPPSTQPSLSSRPPQLPTDKLRGLQNGGCSQGPEGMQGLQRRRLSTASFIPVHEARKQVPQ